MEQNQTQTPPDERVVRLSARRERAARIRGDFQAKRKRIVSLAEAEKREDLTDRENSEFKDLSAKIRELDHEISEYDERLSELADDLGRTSIPAVDDVKRALSRGDEDRAGDSRGVPSLVPNASDLAMLAASARQGERYRLEVRATVNLAAVGGPIDRHEGIVPEPRRLVAAVGLPAIDVPMRGVSGAKYGTETVSAPTSEGSTKPEYDAISALTIVPQTFAWWTDMTRQAIESAGGLRDVAAAHARQIAMDEDSYIISALSTEAGTAVAFNSDVVGNVRTQMATIEATVGAPVDVLICNPADYKLFAVTTPTNASDVASHVVRFNGAQVYASNSQASGFVIVAALAAVGRYVVHGNYEMATQEALKSNVVTVRSELFSGFGIPVAGGVKSVDVVTP